MSVTRFPNGVGDVTEGPLKNVRGPLPRKQIRAFSDFYDGAPGVDGDFVLAGTVQSVLGLGAGGYVSIPGSGTASVVTPSAIFVANTPPLVAQASIAMEMRAAFISPGSITGAFGLADALPTPTQGIFFSIVAGVTTFNVLSTGGGAAVALPIDGPAGGAEALGFGFTLEGRIASAYVNLTKVGEVTLDADQVPQGNLLAGAALAGGGGSIEADYMLFTQERALT